MSKLLTIIFITLLIVTLPITGNAEEFIVLTTDPTTTIEKMNNNLYLIEFKYHNIKLSWYEDNFVIDGAYKVKINNNLEVIDSEIYDREKELKERTNRAYLIMTLTFLGIATIYLGWQYEWLGAIKKWITNKFD